MAAATSLNSGGRAGGRKSTRISTAATTLVKGGFGRLHGIVVGKAVASGTITIYDNTAGSGPVIGVITFPATLLANQANLDFKGLEFSTGLTIVTVEANDLTVIWE